MVCPFGGLPRESTTRPWYSEATAHRHGRRPSDLRRVPGLASSRARAADRGARARRPRDPRAVAPPHRHSPPALVPRPRGRDARLLLADARRVRRTAAGRRAARARHGDGAAGGGGAEAGARLPRMASRRRARLRAARDSLPGRVRSPRALRRPHPADRLGRGGPSPGLWRRFLRPDPGDPTQAHRHRCRLRAGPDEDDQATGLRHPDGLDRDRARRVPARPGRARVPGRGRPGRARSAGFSGVLRGRDCPGPLRGSEAVACSRPAGAEAWASTPVGGYGLIWARISPLGFAALWTFTYRPPDRYPSNCALVRVVLAGTVQTPSAVLASGLITGPLRPIAPSSRCAAAPLCIVVRTS